ncbi:MAG: recombinase family protein, partial [Burkholderiales bacterium]
MAVALYARVSTTRQADKDLSIPDQLRQMRDWCRAQGLAVAVEYVEPGASATDDRRPVFQQMIADATLSPSPHEAVIVHSRSRFFRDLFQFLGYERSLKRAGVKLISITQQTSDDPAGEMAKTIFSLFDEYQSKENAKHTLRAMLENARQGYFNGSRPPFGFRAGETEAPGRRGKKKHLQIDHAEAAIVRQAFDLYLRGYKGSPLGEKGIAAHLNVHGVSLRGQKWTKNKVHQLLSNTAYCGEYVFNRIRNKTGEVKPETEWIKIAVEPIIDPGTFEQIRSRRASRAPGIAPPRVVNSPTLLTGLLRCGACGAGMTLATGKGGKYRYYKCQSRIAQGNSQCASKNIPMEKLDALVLNAFAEKVTAPARMKAMVAEARRHLQNGRSDHDNQLKLLTHELNDLQARSGRLFEAVETGHLPLDGALRQRAQKLQGRRQEVLIQIAGIKQQGETPLKLLNASQVDAFARALKSKLTTNSPFAKQYLRLLVSEIKVNQDDVQMQGSYAALVGAIANAGGTGIAPVPSFAPKWLP